MRAKKCTKKITKANKRGIWRSSRGCHSPFILQFPSSLFISFFQTPKNLSHHHHCHHYFIVCTMGFMAEGNTLGWAEASKHAEYIRQHGIQQLLHIYKQYKDRKNDKLQWGDEVCAQLCFHWLQIITCRTFQVEYIIAHIDEEHKHARVSLRAYDVLQVLMQEEKKNPEYVLFVLQDFKIRF